jgi:succinoglycan biosynthesis transport protein ExoP
MNNAVEIVRQPNDGGQLPAPIEPRHSPDADDRLDLNALLDVLRRRARLFLGILAGVMALTVILTLNQQPLYTATSRVVLVMREETITPTISQKAAIPLSDRVDTEVEVLKSRKLADKVAQALNLAEDPSFNPALAPPGPIEALIAEFIGQKPEPAPDPAETRRQIVDQLMHSLEVTRMGETYVMEIGITTTTPRNAARIANEYGRQYTQGQLQEKLDENRTASRFLASRLEELRAQAQSDTQRVQQYRIAHNLLSTSGASLTEQEISAYNQSVASARVLASEDHARLNTARAQLLKGSNGDDVGEALGSSVVGGLRGQQAVVSAQVATLQARYGSRHPDVLKAKSELADVDRRIGEEIHRVISNLEAKARVSRERLSSISGTLAGARGSLAQNNRAMTGLDDLQRRAQSSQALYESYLNRYKETVAQGGTERPDAGIISRAERPGSKSSPRLTLNLLLGFVIGSGLGLAASFLAEMLFSGLTTGVEVEQKLRIPYLTGIPLLSSVSSTKGGSSTDAVVDDPHSGYAEAFRSLRTSLRYRTRQAPQIFAISSALPKEGKTTIAICLARSMAIAGEQVVLVDCDFTKYGLSRRIGADGNAAGLAELLDGKALLDEAIFIDKKSGAHVLGLRAESHMFADKSGAALTSLLGALRRRYSFIIIDTAPILPIAETRMLTALADAIIFVVRWRHTPDHAARAALRLLPATMTSKIGCVLSKMHILKQRRFGRGDAAYYYDNYKQYYKE